MTLVPQEVKLDFPDNTNAYLANLVSMGILYDMDGTHRIDQTIYNKIKEVGGKFSTIVASTAHVSHYATLGEGTVVMHQAVVNAGAKIGENCIINTFCNMEHDAVIGDQCHISTGTMVNGDCKVGGRVFIGSQSVLANGIIVGEEIIVGAGSVVRKSISEKGVYAGNPAILKVKSK